MVVDFSRLKREWQEVEEHLDHQLLNSSLDILPSTENVAGAILTYMHLRIPEVYKVRLWEGPEQFAEVEVGD